MKHSSIFNSKELKIILLIIFFVTTLINLIFILPSLKKKSNFKIDGRIDTIFIGDSHTKYGISEKDKNIKNFGVRSEKFKFTLVKLKKIIEANPNIKNVYLSINYHSFLKSNASDLNIESNSKFFLKNYLYLFKNPWEVYPIINKSHIYIYYYAKYFLGFPLGIAQTMRFFRESKENQLPIIMGGENVSNSSDLSSKRLNATLERHFKEGEVTLWGEAFTDFLKLNNFLVKEGIQLFVYSSPLHSSYRSQIPSEALWIWSEVIKKLKDEKINYSNFQTVYIPDNQYFDHDHLNSKGAMNFTRMLLGKTGGKE